MRVRAIRNLDLGARARVYACLVTTSFTVFAFLAPILKVHAEIVPLDTDLLVPSRAAQRAALARLAPSVAKTSALIRQIVDDEEAVKIYIERNGVERAAGEFREYAPMLADDEARAGARSRRLLHNLLTVMREANRPESDRQRWKDLFRELRAARELAAALEKHLAPVDLLLWLEEAHRFLELDLAQKPETARAFLDENLANLDALWLRTRLSRLALREPGEETLVHANGAERGPSPELDRILRARIAAYAAAGGEARRAAVTNYCNILAGHGLAREIDLDVESSPDWAREFHSAPGCLTIRQAVPVAGAIVRIITEDDVQMAYDSVVRAEGVNISVSARSFDGSLFDLSAAEPSIEGERNAGGSLTIDVRHEDRSLLPGFVSLGVDLPGHADMDDSDANTDAAAAASPAGEDIPPETQSRVNGLLSFLVNGELRTL